MLSGFLLLTLIGGTYADEYKEAQITGTLDVYMSAEWCGPCRITKPHLAFLKKYAYVDVDKERDLANMLFKESGKSLIPQLLRFRRTKGNWTVQVFTGPAEIIHEIDPAKLQDSKQEDSR